MTAAPEVTYTTAEVASALGVSEWTVCKWVKQGRVSPIRVAPDRINSPYRFTPADYEQLKESLRPAPVEPTRKRRRRRAA